MTIIKLHIPDDLADKVAHLAENAETFILNLLRSKFNESDNPRTLAEQYRMAGVENASLKKDFAHTDQEGWDEEY